MPCEANPGILEMPSVSLGSISCIDVLRRAMADRRVRGTPSVNPLHECQAYVRAHSGDTWMAPDAEATRTASDEVNTCRECGSADCEVGDWIL